MPQIKEFPQEIFVAVDGDSSAEWLSIYETPAEALGEEEVKRVAVYKLTGVNEYRKAPPSIKLVRSKKTR